MIDDSDADEFMLFSLFTDGWPGIVLAILAVILYFVAAGNSADCSKKSCPTGMQPKLMDHACLCTMEAK